jgi:hypothetical protein
MQRFTRANDGPLPSNTCADCFIEAFLQAGSTVDGRMTRLPEWTFGNGAGSRWAADATTPSEPTSVKVVAILRVADGPPTRAGVGARPYYESTAASGRATRNGTVQTGVPAAVTDRIVVCDGLIGLANRGWTVRRHDRATCRIHPLRNVLRHAAAGAGNRFPRGRRPNDASPSSGLRATADAGEPLNLGK